MDRSRFFSLKLLAASLGVVLVGACAPEGECQGYEDCPIGDYCQAGECVSGNLPDAGPSVPRDGGTLPPRDSGPPPDGGDPRAGEEQVRTTFDVPWIQWDSRVSGRILIGEQQEVGGIMTVDRVRALDTETLRIAPAPVYDLTTLASGACRLDSIVFDAAPNETWFNCDIPPGLRIIFNNDLPNPGNEELASAHVVHVVPKLGTDFARALVAERGGQLRAWQLRPSDGINQEREIDSLVPGVGGVVAIFDLTASNVPGSHVLVHDGETSRLVPLTRLPGAEEWSATAALEPLSLPQETHVVFLLGPISANGNSLTPNAPNFMTIEPATGLARYWNYETGQELLPATIFEPDSLHHAAKPNPDERLLFAPSPAGNYVFYTRARADKIYRIPIEPGGTQDVRQRLLDDTTRVISSLLAVDDETVWVSYSSENLVERLKVIEQR